MGHASFGVSKQGTKPFRFYIIIFLVGMVFSFSLWDAYYREGGPFGDVSSSLILLMGTLFSFASGLFSWSLETRHNLLEKEVEKRTRELYEKNEELVKRNEEIKNLTRIISHDLKAPVISIQGFLSILKRELGERLQGRSVDYLNRIQANTRQMTDLISDLLEFSRVGQSKDEKETVDLTELFKEILGELKPEIDQRGIRVQLESNFPKLWSSRKQLGQVFTNLVVNAIKYMGSTREPFIEIGCSHGSNVHTLWVKDNGVGIRKEFHEKIFQIFQRAPSQVKVEGTGIGLSIVKKIVELNGGRVWVQSEEGKGSQFFIEWPFVEPRPDEKTLAPMDSIVSVGKAA